MSVVTPNRKTRVIFDLPDSALTSKAWGIRRSGGEIAQRFAAGQVDDTLHNNVKLWPSTGAITLRPLQTEISNITEYSVSLNLIQVPDNQTLVEKLVTAGTLAIENNYRYNDDLPGLPASSAILPSGGPFIVKKISAGESWDNSIASGTPSLIGGNAAPPVTPLDRVGESNQVYPENQAWFLNWSVPGGDLDYPQFTLAFYFGNFGIAFTGSGKATLYENVRYAGDGSLGWVNRKEWKYARTGQVSNTAHSVAIWPHVRGNAKYISFTNGQLDLAEVSSSAQSTTATGSAPGDATYTAVPDPRYVSLPAGVVTQAGPFRFDIRRDLNLKLQISTLGWPTSGYLVDDPALLPAPNPQLPVSAFADTVMPAGTNIVSTLLDAVSGDVFDSTIHTQPVARFDFSGDGTNTPILWSYSMSRDAATGISAPGAFSGGNLKSVNIAGYSGDPTQETATLVIDDVRGELLPLYNRARLSVRVEVDHEENGEVFTTPIFSGFASRVDAERKSKPGRAYPSPARQIYTLPLFGQWLKLSQAVNHGLQNFLFYDASTNPADPLYGQSPAGGPQIPWKVTDAIAYLLLAAGFTQSQLSIPDLPLRLWTGQGDKKDEFAIDPAADYAEMAQRLCRNYMGLYLCYDLPTGTWTVLQGTPLDAAPLYSFYTGSASQVTGKPGVVDTLPGAYGPKATFITEFQTTTVPPDFNAVHVACPVAQTSTRSKQMFENWQFNYNSFAVPGGIPPDPNHPDYVTTGLNMTEIVDPSLYCGAGNDAQTQAAVDWTTRRIFDFCCHAQRLAHFTSPMIFLVDPITGQYRLPRFLDPISINGQPYQVKCCAPNYTFDGRQMAHWEAIQPIAGQFIPPGIESLSFLRRATAQHSQKAAGSSTHGWRFGNLGTPPHADDRYRDLPRNVAYQHPLQDPVTGKPYFMVGYDSLESDFLLL